MEELRSTDALDQEIRSDARKRAEKILAKADESAKALLDGVQERVSEAEKTARQASQARCESFKRNNEASIPLEHQRTQVSYIHNAIIEALNVYLEKLSEKERLLIIKTQLERALPFLAQKEVNAYVIGFDLTQAKKMLSGVLKTQLVSCKKGSENLIADEAVSGIKLREGVVLNTSDKSISCRLTLDEKIKEILDEKTDELALALFGGRLPA